ncbi:MAG: ribbon-helix-helix protein, CopG family [Elusimicrobia bacterium]|nr:ribbon-helix-helix protein, CopG family [Elusimicrobiota bacterium]
MNKTVTITLRLTADERKVLDRVARAHGATRSEAIRTALLGEAARIARTENLSGHERLKRYIPAKGSGRKDLSALDSSRIWAEDLEAKHRALRPR